MQALEHPRSASFAELAVAVSEYAFHEADQGSGAEAFVAGLEFPSPAMERVAASIKRRASLLAEARRQLLDLAEYEEQVRELLRRIERRRRRREAVAAFLFGVAHHAQVAARLFL